MAVLVFSLIIWVQKNFFLGSGKRVYFVGRWVIIKYALSKKICLGVFCWEAVSGSIKIR